ncbi:hypothetical protein NL676_004826 [Syzygium grande]|nr:hypothetical protein NL676_004826 [Syzygium grande]
MEHEATVLAEKVQSERSQRLHDFVLQKKELETSMQNEWDEMENNLRGRIKSFEEEKERELNNINYLREVARREMEGMKQERAELQKEREEFTANKKHLEEDEQVEIRKDIEQLVALGKKMKDQREKFIEGRDRFISFAKQQNSCNTWGTYSRVSAFRSTIKTDSHPVQDSTQEERVHGDHANVACAENDAELSFAVASASFDVEGHPREDEACQDTSYDSNVDSKRQEVAEDSQPSDLNNGVHQPRERGRARANRTRTMKEVGQDANTTVRKGFGSNETERENGNAEDSAPTNADDRDEPSLADKGRPRNVRKTGRDNTRDRA